MAKLEGNRLQAACLARADQLTMEVIDDLRQSAVLLSTPTFASFIVALARDGDLVTRLVGKLAKLGLMLMELPEDKEVHDGRD